MEQDGERYIQIFVVTCMLYLLSRPRVDVTIEMSTLRTQSRFLNKGT